MAVKSIECSENSQLPPTHATEGSASQVTAVAGVMPPVGQNRTPPNGPPNARRVAKPPAASAGKNLNRAYPNSRPRMISVAVATPGSRGTPRCAAARARDSVKPGDTANFAPALIAASRSRSQSTVPAPTTTPGTRLISEITSRAAGVRRVTSRTGKPPEKKASATRRAGDASARTSTGTTGAIAKTLSMFTSPPLCVRHSEPFSMQVFPMQTGNSALLCKDRLNCPNLGARASSRNLLDLQGSVSPIDICRVIARRK